MFTPNLTLGSSGSDYGLKMQVQRLNKSSHELATQQAEPDLTHHVATQIESKHAFSANINTLRTQDQMVGTLLDLVG